MTRRFNPAVKLSALRGVAAALFMAAAVVALVARAGDARQQAGSARGVGAEIRIKVEDGSAVKLYERSYALVVGVSDYAAGWPRLPGVKKDAEAVTRALQRHGFEVTVVSNPDSLQLDRSFKSFIDEHGASVENRLLFYFAGHGHTIRQSYGEEMGYIVPADAPLPSRDARGFMSKAMDMQQMELYARRIQSKHALFLFDSCFSGSLFALSRAVPESISYKTARPVRQFITAGDADEAVPDRSVFREQFVAALEGEADLNRDGYVTGTELGEFLQDKVINYTRNAQHPQYGKIRNPNLDKGDFVFALPRANPPATATANAPPTVTPNASPPAGSGAPPVEIADIEQSYWELIKDSADTNDFRAYLKKYPQGRFATKARRKISQADAAARVQERAPPSPGVTTVNEIKVRVFLLATTKTAAGVQLFEVAERELSTVIFRSLPVGTTTTWINEDNQYDAKKYRDLIDKLRRGDKKAATAIPYPVVIVATLTINEAPPVQGIFVSYVSGTISATDVRAGQTVASETFNDVRGFGNDRAQANREALKNAAESLSQSFRDKVAEAAR